MKNLNKKEWLVVILIVIGFILIILSIGWLTNGFNFKRSIEVPTNYAPVYVGFTFGIVCLIAGLIGLMFNEANKKGD